MKIVIIIIEKVFDALNSSYHTVLIHCSFSIKTCCKTAKIDDFKSLKLSALIEAETYEAKKKFSRVWFGRDSQDIRYNATLDSKNTEHCYEEIVYLKVMIAAALISCFF